MLIGRPDRSKARPPDHPEWFSGPTWHYRLTESQSEGGVSVLAVWFEAGSRTRPHVHPVEQTLQVMEGVGIVATAKKKRIIREGDSVVVPARTWHWHGALPDQAMMHLSIKQSVDPDDWTAPWNDWDTYAEGAE